MRQRSFEAKVHGVRIKTWKALLDLGGSGGKAPPVVPSMGRAALTVVWTVRVGSFCLDEFSQDSWS